MVAGITLLVRNSAVLPKNWVENDNKNANVK